MKQQELVTGSAGSLWDHLCELPLAPGHGVPCIDSSFNEPEVRLSGHKDNLRFEQKLETEFQEIEAADMSASVISPPRYACAGF